VSSGDKPRHDEGEKQRSRRARNTMVSSAERIAEITGKMLRRKLYVVLSTATASAEQVQASLPAHLDYMIDLEKKGLVFASGPFSDSQGNPRGNGMTILRSKDADEARKIAEADPFVANGLRTFEIREWTVMEGSFGVTVNFSDQSVEVV
jgi:uncharacterized protein